MKARSPSSHRDSYRPQTIKRCIVCDEPFKAKRFDLTVGGSCIPELTRGEAAHDPLFGLDGCLAEIEAKPFQLSRGFREIINQRLVEPMKAFGTA